MSRTAFPRTPHLFIPPGLDIRDDKVLSGDECADMLRHTLVVEEKVDGANLGISLDDQGRLEYQNRNHRFSAGGKGQFEALGAWAYRRFDLLERHLAQRYVLFGEWCYARHSVHYDRLPDLFLGFDVYDRQEECFLATAERDRFFSTVGVTGVRRIADGKFTRDRLLQLLLSERSAYADNPVEGLVLRQDDKGRLAARAKLVRPDYSAPHFLDRRIKWKFIHPENLKNEQNDTTPVHGCLQDQDLPGGPQGTRDHRSIGEEA